MFRRKNTAVIDDRQWEPDPRAPASMEMEHLGGVPWFKAPLPPAIHRCTPQTRGWSGLTRIKRCACGATWIMDGWTGKNESRKSGSKRA